MTLSATRGVEGEEVKRSDCQGKIGLSRKDRSEYSLWSEGQVVLDLLYFGNLSSCEVSGISLLFQKESASWKFIIQPRVY